MTAQQVDVFVAEFVRGLDGPTLAALLAGDRARWDHTLDALTAAIGTDATRAAFPALCARIDAARGRFDLDPEKIALAERILRIVRGGS